ncbi:MAG: 30S ribosomal protein S8 [Bdellovibrionales bacterium]|nr:30S ribosomal protein S8 [Bdellovibrionales bacterium]
MLTDTLADTLTRIRNGQRVGHKSVRVRSSKMIESVLAVLKSEGFIGGYDKVPSRNGSFEEFEVSLRYLADGGPAIGDAVRISKPGRRVYSKSGELPKVHRGLGIAIISTSQGVLPDRLARKQQIGGEVIAYIS